MRNESEDIGMENFGTALKLRLRAAVVDVRLYNFCREDGYENFFGQTIMTNSLKVGNGGCGFYSYANESGNPTLGRVLSLPRATCLLT